MYVEGKSVTKYVWGMKKMEVEDAAAWFCTYTFSGLCRNVTCHAVLGFCHQFFRKYRENILLSMELIFEYIEGGHKHPLVNDFLRVSMCAGRASWKYVIENQLVDRSSEVCNYNVFYFHLTQQCK